MKEIGGYFELDPGGGNTPLPNGVMLNSGRNALQHIVRQLKISSIWVPEYTCPVVWDALKAENCELKFYSIGMDMLPAEKMPQHDFVLYPNYFGCCGRNVEMLTADYPNLIVDCAQAYHAKPKGRASFSSPRKFFGVPDGGVAYGVDGDAAYAVDDSSGRMQHLIVRKEQGAEAGYALFRAASQTLVGAPIRKMSAVTAGEGHHCANRSRSSAVAPAAVLPDMSYYINDTMSIGSDPPYAEMCGGLGLTGVMNCEFIRTDDALYLMDINPRFSAGVSFSKMAGYDFVMADAACYQADDLAPLSSVKAGAVFVKRFFDFSG